MQPFLKTASAAIASFEGTVVISLLIALFGILAFVRFRQLVRALGTELDEATRHLLGAAGETEFGKRFPSFDKHFREHALLGHAWKEFSDSLITPAPDAPTVYKNPHESREYFSLDSVAHERVNLRFYEAVPGYLTGFGILGTFVGLVSVATSHTMRWSTSAYPWIRMLRNAMTRRYSLTCAAVAVSVLANCARASPTISHWRSTAARSIGVVA